MHTTAIVGPPGTGKTRYLSGIVNDLAKTTPNMAVVSFTRAAAGVLTSRLKNHSIRYIGTLHALAFRALDMTKQGVATEENFAKWYGDDLDEVRVVLSIYRYMHHRAVDLSTAFAVMNPVIPFIKVEHMITSYLNWKARYNYLDFDDMVAAATSKVEPFDVVIVDEAQDCTDKQWDFVLSMLNPDGQLFIAGDDDQSLFTWAGANPHAMDDLSDEIIVLEQSYRIPLKVHQTAESTVGQIGRRIPKTYNPAPKEGKVEHASYYEPVWYPKKHTVLCRDKWALEAVESVIMERGIPYTKNGERSMFDRPRCRCARSLILEDYAGVKKLFKYLKPEYRNDPVAACAAGWRKALDFGTWYKESSYLHLVDPTSDPLIHLSTIHGFKGEEDDHIILIADCTAQVEKAIETQEAYDNEVRVWYVGLTRCKEKLTIVGWNQFIKRGELQ